MSGRIRLLGLDLDGTLLNNNKQITRMNQEKIIELMKRGITVVPITGRPEKGIPVSIQKLFCNSYIITSNGAVTTDNRLKRIIDSSLMKNDTVMKILSSLYNVHENIEIEIFADGIGYVQNKHLKKIKTRFKGTPLESYIENSRRPMENLSDYISSRNNDIAGISIMTPSILVKEEIKNLLKKISGINIISSVQTDLEINSETAEKGLALLRLAEKLGINKSEIMACGDSGNDIEMIQTVGIGVAMNNASEAVKKVADFITLSNEENGVAYAIDRYILSCS